MAGAVSEKVDMPAGMGPLAQGRPPEMGAQLVQPQTIDDIDRHPLMAGSGLGKRLAERPQILKDLDDKVDKLQLARTALRGAVAVHQHRMFVPAEQFGGVLHLVPENRQYGTKIGPLDVRVWQGLDHSRPTTASMAFFMVAVVKGLRTRLFSPSFWPFWISSGVGVPVTRI